jgi:hypothetical protein
MGSSKRHKPGFRKSTSNPEATFLESKGAFKPSTDPAWPAPRERVLPSRQKDVYRWFESRKDRETSEPVRIYHPSWEARIDKWYDTVSRKSPLALDEIDVNAPVTNDLDLRVLFFRDPVTAYVLWDVLHAAYRLDSAVCGPEAKSELARWRKWKPFKYLLSLEVDRRWVEELKTLGELMRTRKFGDQDIVMRAHEIHQALGNLKEKVGVVRERLGDEESEVENGNGLPGTILGKSMREAVESMYWERCAMGPKYLKPKDKSHHGDANDSERTKFHDPASDSDAQGNYDLGKSLLKSVRQSLTVFLISRRQLYNRQPDNLLH